MANHDFSLNQQQQHQLIAGARDLGANLNQQQVNQFSTYSNLLYIANRHTNLTRIHPEDAVSLHFLDALSAAQVVDFSKPLRLIDVGTGPGIPGIPLKLAFPELKIAMTESSRKKASFLSAAVTTLGLTDTTVSTERAELLGHDPVYREQFDLAVARGLSHMFTLVELLLPFIAIGGHILAYKSDNIGDEMAKAGELIPLLGGEVEKQLSFQLPGTQMTRTLVLIHKIAPTPQGYPRSSQYFSRTNKKLSVKNPEPE